MNIFLLDYNLRKCVEYHVDKHVVKMILEYVQILCTVLHLRGIYSPYKPAYIKHPCVLWCNRSRDNWVVLKKLVTYLNDEYVYRYNKICNHKSFDVIKEILPPDESIFPSIGITKFYQAMPLQYTDIDTVTAYRTYYINDKKHIAKWTKRTPPPWFC